MEVGRSGSGAPFYRGILKQKSYGPINNICYYNIVFIYTMFIANLHFVTARMRLNRRHRERSRGARGENRKPDHPRIYFNYNTTTPTNLNNNNPLSAQDRSARKRRSHNERLRGEYIVSSFHRIGLFLAS